MLVVVGGRDTGYESGGGDDCGFDGVGDGPGGDGDSTDGGCNNTFTYAPSDPTTCVLTVGDASQVMGEMV